MVALRLLCLLLTVALASLVHAHPMIGHHRQKLIPLCEGCGEQCHNCRYGFIVSKLCGVPVCRRGPGDICGGPSDSWGVCGDGLLCNDCNRFVGCSLDDYLCDQEPCLPHRSVQSRWSDLFLVD